jgi:hypothetical protein
MTALTSSIASILDAGPMSVCEPSHRAILNDKRFHVIEQHPNYAANMILLLRSHHSVR